MANLFVTAEKCKSQSNCHFWTFSKNANSGCYIKSANALGSAIKDQKVISGARNCTSESTGGIPYFVIPFFMAQIHFLFSLLATDVYLGCYEIDSISLIIPDAHVVLFSPIDFAF